MFVFVQAAQQGALTYLEPSQREAATKVYSGPAKLLGGAGTGKTVVALHRAVGLSRRHPGARVLLTTFSKTLAVRLQHQVSLLESPVTGPATEPPVHVEHLHKLAVRLWQERVRAPFTPLSEAELLTRLERLAAGSGEGAFSPAFLQAEWEGVIEPQGVRTWEAYKQVPRTGRGVALGLRGRMQVWAVLDALQRELAADGVMSFERLCVDLAERLKREARAPFDHVVADEVQDFGPAELRLLRALAAPTEDDLFLTGDSGQRTYKAGSSFLAAGVDVRGRSSILRLNYRTTEQIRRYADALLPGALRDPDGDPETRHTVSLLSGPSPETLRFAHSHEEAHSLADRLSHYLDSGYEPRDIAIFARTRHTLVGRVTQALELAGVEGVYLSDSEPLLRAGVALGTMHRAKGSSSKSCRSSAARLISCPLRRSPALTDAASRDAFYERERSLFYETARFDRLTSRSRA